MIYHYKIELFTKKKAFNKERLGNMVEPVGIEPMTCSLRTNRSSQLSYGPEFLLHLMYSFLLKIKPNNHIFRIKINYMDSC